MGTAVNIVTRKLGIPLEIVLTIGSETKKVAIAFGDLKNLGPQEMESDSRDRKSGG